MDLNKAKNGQKYIAGSNNKKKQPSKNTGCSHCTREPGSTRVDLQAELPAKIGPKGITIHGYQAGRAAGQLYRVSSSTFLAQR